jgi:hypothetical protein
MAAMDTRVDFAAKTESGPRMANSLQRDELLPPGRRRVSNLEHRSASKPN